MAISGAKFVYGLSATGTNTKVNVNGSAVIGVGQTQLTLPSDTDIFYSFRVTLDSAEEATWNLRTHTFETVSGSPTVTDGDGNNFEGSTLADMVTFYGSLFFAPGPAGMSVNVTSPTVNTFAHAYGAGNVSFDATIAQTSVVANVFPPGNPTDSSNSGDNANNKITFTGLFLNNSSVDVILAGKSS